MPPNIPIGFADRLKPTLLSRPALKSLTKHLNSCLKVIDKEIKDDPDKKYSLADVRNDICNTWLTVYNVHHQREVDAATKRDKGEVLWTVFKPTSSGCLEIIRTPNRKITIHWYKNYGREGYHRSDTEHTEVKKKWDNNPWAWDFSHAMTPEDKK